jgi:3-mercaptopyruvate sulfurtransferase SseA
VAEELDSRPSDFKQVIDARDAADYGKPGDGKNNSIKNSINLPFEEVLNADGTFKSDDEIK